MTGPSTSRLLRGLSTYQDLVLGGRTVARGTRDCPARWAVIEPHLPQAGTILDVGSNFGWFGLQICASRPQCVVASVEADLRSAAVQHEVLRSNAAERICLLTDPAGAAMARRFAAAGQRLDAVLCLSILHWIADHRPLLATLAKIAGRFLIEQPDPREQGAGVERIRQEIGPLGPYLAGLFPDRPVSCLARLPSHRDSPWMRELWLVGEPVGWPAPPASGLDAATLVQFSPGWPPRSWWRRELSRCAAQRVAGRVLLGPGGLSIVPGPVCPDGLRGLRRRLRCIPEHGAFTPTRLFYRRLRRLAGGLLRRFAKSLHTPGGG
jgi:hypothetical protein